MLYTCIYCINTDTMINDASRTTQEGRRIKASLEKHSPLTLLQGFERVVQGFACERVLVTEHKLHILTPLLWPSRCVFLVLLDAQPEVLGVYWQLHRGFLRSPSVGCGLPYHISSLTIWESAGNCFGTPNSIELNNNSTPTRSPTGSLKSNV